MAELIPDEAMDAPVDDEPEAGSGYAARVAALEAAGDDDAFVTACDGDEPASIVLNADGSATVTCADATVEVPADVIAESLGEEVDDGEPSEQVAE